MRNTIATFSIVIGMFFSSGMQSMASGSVVVDRVVAVVNEDIITLSDLQREESLKKLEGKMDAKLVLEDMRLLARALQLDEKFVLEKLLAHTPRKSRDKLKTAIRAARGGH